MEFAAALTLPAAVALFVIPGAIIHVLFERGAFTATDTAATAPALAAYAVGLPAFVAIKVLQPAFFAREDTSAPMWYGGISMVVNVVAAFVLGWFSTVLLERLPVSRFRRPFVGTGICGGLSTFSTMQVETIQHRPASYGRFCGRSRKTGVFRR